jgi:hypothetical protein
MPEGSLNLLLVDDAPNVKEEIEKGLKKIGIPVIIDYQCPVRRDEPFGGCKLPAGKEFDKVDLALVDLELFPQMETIHYTPEDLRGGTEILPYIRREAPWIPVIAYSRLFKKEAEYFLSIACSFGFDGHTTRGMFGANWLTRELWDGIVSRALVLRRHAILGEQFIASENDMQFDLTQESGAKLNSRFPSWKRVVRNIFCFGKKVVLEPLVGGWSGAQVWKAYVRQRNEDGGREGEWVWKISSSPWKLHKELQAHLRMQRGGLDFARAVPPLWQGVIYEDGTAGIAYQFAKNTQEAITLLRTEKDVKIIGDRISSILCAFYRESVNERGVIENIISKWCPKKEDLLSAADVTKGTFISQVLKAIAEKKGHTSINRTCTYKQCLIHGDMHLGNVMLGDNDVFIDFALSDVGPISVDIAKIVSDILLRIPHLRREKLPEWNNKSDPVMHVLEKLNNNIGLSLGDIDIFNMMLRIYIAQALNYGDISGDTKDWILDILKTDDVIVDK